MQSRYDVNTDSSQHHPHTQQFAPPHINVPNYKILLLGNQSSGRTSLFTQYCNGCITQEPSTTDKINIGIKLVQTIIEQSNTDHNTNPKFAAPRTLHSIQLYDTPALHFTPSNHDNNDHNDKKTTKSISQALIEQMLQKHEFDAICIVVSCVDLTSFSAIAAYKLIVATYYNNDYNALPAVLCATKADLQHEFTPIDISDSAERNHMKSGLLCSTDSNAATTLLQNIDNSFIALINYFATNNQLAFDVNATAVVYNISLDTPVSTHKTRAQLRPNDSNAELRMHDTHESFVEPETIAEHERHVDTPSKQHHIDIDSLQQSHNVTTDNNSQRPGTNTIQPIAREYNDTPDHMIDERNVDVMQPQPIETQ